MLRRRAIWPVAIGLLAACEFASLPRPSLAKSRENAKRERSSEQAARSATLLASHGEPGLAWDALRAAGSRGDKNAALAARLLTELHRYAQAESVLARGKAPKDDSAARWYTVQRARLSVEAGHGARALELLADVAAPSTDPVAAYIDYVRARALAQTGDPAGALAALARARAGALPDALAGLVDDERVRALRTLGKSAEALEALDDALTHAADSAERRRLLILGYRIAREAGNGEATASCALRLVDDYRAFAEAETCALDVTRSLPANGIATRLLLACGESFLARERPQDLRNTLRALDERKLSGDDREHRRILWCEYHYVTGDFARALSLARPAYAEPSFKRRSIIVMARSLRSSGRRAEAAAVYEQFARAFPNDVLAAEALFAAASLREDNRQPDENARLLDLLRRSYPSTFHGWAAAMRRADELREAGDVEEAAAIYEQWLARSRRTDEAALFYLSRLYESSRAGDSANLLLDELRRVNPYSFYVSPDVGTRARGPLRDASGSGGAASLASWLATSAGERERAYQRVLDIAENADGDEPWGATARGALERGRRFLDAGFRDWAERELEVVRRQSALPPDVALVLAKTYEEYAMPWRSVRVYDRARTALPWETRQERADDFRYLMYPLPYPARVFDAAAQSEVPAHLIYAIMREESHFESDVVSRAGAIGLMQLMPETAQRVARAKELGIDVDNRLDDPQVNVAIGTWYASDLLRQGDGSVAWMLAAYNAGPGAAQRWLEPGVSGDDAIVAVESIDYRETRGYVKRVVESANIYQSLYFAETRSKN